MSSNEASSLDREYQALKSGRAVVVLEGWSSFTVTGADRQSFLHNFCTNDVKRLVPGESCEAFFTNVKGKIVGHGVQHCRESEMVFVGVSGQAPRLWGHLDRYVIREDVVLTDTTNQKSFLLVTGDLPGSLSGAAISWNIVDRDDSRIIEVDSNGVSELVATLAAQGFELVGTGAFEAARIEAGMPWYGVDFTDENLPQEVGRDEKAISFTKGCYLGQETVARIDALGHVNQRIAGVRFSNEDVPPLGTELTREGRPVGAVTSAAYSPSASAPIALAMLRREANSPGTELESSVGRCAVISLPIK